MITLPLRMRCAERPLRPAAAWLIPGGEPRIWLDEMLAWGVPLGNAAFYAIPRSANDLAPQGILVVLPPRGLPEQTEATCQSPRLAPRTTHRSQAYAALRTHHAPRDGVHHAERDEYEQVVYLPVDALIDPAASDAEVAEVAAEVGDCILHPSLGRIRLDADDRRSVVDLIIPPVERPARWDLAEPGQRVNARLTAIVPAETFSVDELLDEGRDDIGSRPPTLDDLPPDPNEPSPGLIGKLGRGLQRKLAQMVKKLAAGGANDPPTTGAAQSAASKKAPSKPGRFAQMANWARQKIAQLDDSLRKSRNRELHRLMNLLENDPDQGLRFALPCGSGRNRGVAPPSGSLHGRNVDFDIRQLGGGRPADPWQLPSDLYTQLRAKYAELAGREVRLGRYRRAAYIYAHLLGDFTNAAAALSAGRHWREAAALYRDRLQRPEMAARCLEQGGLWAEAIEFYEELEDFEKVGDLYAQLEQPKQAEEAWRRAVKMRLADHDHLAAARLLETRLKSPDEALETLAAAWPASAQAGPCLAEQFALLGRLGRHEAAERRVGEIRQEELNASVRMRVIDLLVENAAAYPHEPVRNAAADATRTIVARHLRQASGFELEQLLESIRRLAPADRLLERDTARYVGNLTKPPRATGAKNKVRAAPPNSVELKRLGEIRLPARVGWQAAVSCGDHFYAAGVGPHGVVLGRGLWNGAVAWRSQRIPGHMSGNSPPIILLACDPRGREPLVLHACGQPPLAMITFAISEHVPREFQAGSPGWIPSGVVAAAYDLNGAKHVLSTVEDGLALTTLDSHNAPLGSRVFPYEPEEAFLTPMCATGTAVYLGLGRRLVRVAGDTTPEVFEMPGIVRSLCGSTLFSVPRIVAALEQGAALLWEEEQRVVPFADGLSRPVAAFTVSGWIVLASADELHVYKTDGKQIQLAVWQGRSVRPVAALATAHPDGFAIVREDGVVEQYQMPPR
jgi:tetratricopeptide (TPR) repeat protein